MKISSHLLRLALLLLSLPPLTAGAQAAAERSSGLAASVPADRLNVRQPAPQPAPKPDLKPTPKPMSPSAQREAATMPDETRPEGQPVPQLNIPLGKGAAGTAKPTVNNAVNSKKATDGGVNDAAARCSAERDDAARQACRGRAIGIAPQR